MHPGENKIITVNGGSSSIKFALYEAGGSIKNIMHGEIAGIHSENVVHSFTDNSGQRQNTKIDAKSFDEAVEYLMLWLGSQVEVSSLKAVGHRIVHGMQHTKPEVITDALIEELKLVSGYDPEHLPVEIRLIEMFKVQHPGVPQIACFDTSFHTTMPTVAKLLPIPRRYFEKGIRRYGFHGLSYSYLLEALENTTDRETSRGKIIMAHLGNGASITAIKDGVSIDTSMGFTPTAGLPMSTRTGDLDPGVAWYLMQSEKMNPDDFSLLVNHQSGLLGISETSSDMRALLKVRNTDNRAAEAVDLFCYQVKKYIGSFAAVTGGIDTLIFSGGIGENAPEVRGQICKGLEFLGIKIDEQKNQKNESIISSGKGITTVRVMKTNEELMIAKLVWNVLQPITKN